MKAVWPFLFVNLLLILNSCNLLDTGGGMDIPHYNTSYKIYSIDTAGGNLKMLASGLDFIASKSSDSLYYQKVNDLYFINGNGTNNQLVASGSQVNGWGWLSFSFDESKVCYREAFINRDGTGLTNIAFSDSVKKQSWCSWTILPDKRIAFGYKDGLYSIAPNGTGLAVLKTKKDSSGSIYSVRYLPQQNALTYVLEGSTGRSLHYFDLSTNTDTLLYNGALVGCDVSPQNKVIFSVYYKLYMMDLTTKAMHQVTDGNKGSFSRDGNLIVYLLPDSSGIYIHNLQSSSFKFIKVNLPGNTFDKPLLSYDNSKIFFIADSVYRVD